MEIRTLKIWPPLFLAPMAGVTHSALRTTIVEFGGIGLLSTEMLAAWRVPNENSTSSPYLVRTDQERPMSYQLLINQVAMVEPAIEALVRFKADSIDFNLGCPAPRVRKAGGGSRLVSRPDVLAAILRKARKCTQLPLSAKIRLGREINDSGFKNLCLMLEGEGIDYLVIHARQDRESFSRTPKWDWAGKVKEWVSIPVVVNGGITSVETAEKCLQQTNADGLMIGRMAAVKPWIFSEIAQSLYGIKQIKSPVLPEVYYQFCQALLDRFREERQLGRLKEFTHYFSENYHFGHHLASRVQSSSSIRQALLRAGEFFSKSDPQGYEQVNDMVLSLEDRFF